MEENKHSGQGEADTILRVAAFAREGARSFQLAPDAAARARAAEELGITAIRKLRFEGQLFPEGRADWRLEAKLGATVVQPCVVTLNPVTTRIDEPVERRFLAKPPTVVEGSETEMPEDDTQEPLGDVIDLWALLLEALALALPPYPRAKGAELGDVRVTEPGKTPLGDEDARPFAGLKGLRDKLAVDVEEPDDDS